MSCRRTTAFLLALALLASVPGPAGSCSLCSNLQQTPTIRQEAAADTARLVLVGTLHNGKDGTNTELRIVKVLRNDPALGGRKSIELGRYLPDDPKTQFLVFCDVFKGKLDPYRGVPLRSDAAAEYVRKAMALDPKDTAGNLLFFFRYLENADAEVARDAFSEFAKATDQDVARAAPRLSPDRVRGWLKDPATPPERLAVYAMLLGGCGGDADAALLEGMLRDDGARTVGAYDGLLAGYMHLRPREGWELALATLRDGRKPLPVRLAAVRTLRFYHGSRPKESRENVLKGMGALLEQGELADLAVEDLRRWGLWDLTHEVLSVYGKKGYDAPIMQRAVVRYALTCKGNDEAARFLTERRRAEPELVREVEESLEFEKGK